MDPYAPLRPIMQRCGTKLTAEDFHSAVNVTFHGFESEHYDEAHQNMWKSLPVQFDLLAEDALSWLAQRNPGSVDSLRMLDIGCGTGLATDCLLKTRLGEKVKHITLLDTSPAMLGRVRQRAAGWGRAFETVEGLLDTSATEPGFDLIITSSVLHHVPDLPAFFAAVTERQRPGGLFLHIQDPNGKPELNPAYQKRRERWEKGQTPAWLQRLAPERILGRIKREITGTQGDNYDQQAIRALVEQGTTPLPLTVHEMYRITDIHVNEADGIRIEDIRGMLASYELISTRTYGFFGELESDLPADLQAEERKLAEEHNLDGFHLGAIWRQR
jgi:2-polyprenyl-3-methyl-5-hydroxy-6-metoxy-1,4-benzoquinol methylase